MGGVVRWVGFGCVGLGWFWWGWAGIVRRVGGWVGGRVGGWLSLRVCGSLTQPQRHPAQQTSRWPGHKPNRNGSPKEFPASSKRAVALHFGGRGRGRAQVYKSGELPSPVDFFDLVADAHRGVVKQAMRVAYAKSSTDVDVVRKPDVKVLAGKDFKMDELVLVALSPSVSMVTEVAKSDANVVIKNVLQSAGKDYHAVIKPFQQVRQPHAARPGAPAKDLQPVIVPFWSVRPSLSPAEANTARTSMTIKVRIGQESMDVEIPTMTNTKPLKIGDEIVVFKEVPVAGDAGHDAPPEKRQRTDKGMGKDGKGKTTAKAKGKGSKGV